MPGPSGREEAPKKSCTHVSPASEVASLHADPVDGGAQIEILLPLDSASVLTQGPATPLREVVPRAFPERLPYLLNLALLL